MKYIVKLIYKDIVEVEVEADSESEAMDLANPDDGTHVDYFLHDASVKEAS